MGSCWRRRKVRVCRPWRELGVLGQGSALRIESEPVANTQLCRHLASSRPAQAPGQTGALVRCCRGREEDAPLTFGALADGPTARLLPAYCPPTRTGRLQRGPSPGHRKPSVDNAQGCICITQSGFKRFAYLRATLTGALRSLPWQKELERVAPHASCLC